MRRPTPSNLVLASLTAMACGYILFGLTLLSLGPTDYTNEAEPAFLALQHGHIGAFLELAPAYGGSLILRAPLVALAALLDTSRIGLFRLVSLPGLIGIVGFGLYLWRDALRLGAERKAAWFALIVISGNLLALMALRSGHSEEPLTALVVVLAAVRAGRKRAVQAGLLVGLAIAMKPWALVAVGPIALMLDRERVKFFVSTAAAAFLVLLPLLLHSGSTIAAARSTGITFKPWQAWWFLGHHVPAATEHALRLHPGSRVPPEWVARISHPLVVLGPAAVCLASRRLLRGRPWHDGLLLLGFVLMLRCLLDTWNHAYYALPAVLVLAVWELHAHRRGPRLACLITALTFLCITVPGHAVPADIQAGLYLAWAVPLTLALGMRVLWPERFARGMDRLRLRRAPARAALAEASAPAR